MKKIFLSLIIFTTVTVYCQPKAFKAEVIGSGQPVILVPGYACSGDVWDALIKDLGTSCQLHVLNIAGFAGIPPIEPPVLATVKKELIQYVRDNHLNKPVLIGQGLGAFISIWAASEDPFLFSKAICVDGVPFISAVYNPAITEAFIKNNKMYNPETMANDSKNKHYRALLGVISDLGHEQQVASWRSNSDPKTLASTLAEISTTDLRQKMSGINIPVLIIGSSYGSKASTQKIFNDQYRFLQDKAIIIATANHFIGFDNPVWFREQVKNFLINGLAN